jgi:hypothetical protein
MRAMLAAAVVTIAMVSESPAAAPLYPWCTTGASQEFGARNCGFVNFEQCMDTARGNGQFCDRNPFYEAPPPSVARTKPRKQRTSPSR